MTAPPMLTATLRAEIARRKLSANQLARETGVAQTAISKFLLGADMRGASLDKLAKRLGMELRAANEYQPTAERRAAVEPAAAARRKKH